MKAEDMLGQKFNRWTVVRLDGKDDGGRARVFCRCDCGTEKSLDAYTVKKGNTVSCGCYRSEVTTERNTTHGLRWMREYDIWNIMIQRCTNPNVKSFRYYGAKGIRVCERWSGADGFANFIADVGPAPSADHSIDRKETSGNYEPGNCRWATKEEQARNKSSNRMLTWKGETKCLAEWAEIVGLSRYALTFRIDRRGWSVDKALSTPPRINQFG